LAHERLVDGIGDRAARPVPHRSAADRVVQALEQGAVGEAEGLLRLGTYEDVQQLRIDHLAARELHLRHWRPCPGRGTRSEAEAGEPIRSRLTYIGTGTNGRPRMSAPKKTILGSWGRSHQSVLVALVLAVGLACSPSDDPGDQGRPQVADGAGRSPDSAARVGDGRPRPGPGYAWVIFGADTVVAEVAATAAERERGLMYREAVPDGTGMLFVFEDNRERAFWMA